MNNILTTFKRVVVSCASSAYRAQLLMDQFRKKAKLYGMNGDVLFVPLGDDFRYLDTGEWKLQMDNYNLLVDHINSRSPEYRMHVSPLLGGGGGI